MTKKIKDLKVGDIFSIPSAPQWGIMIKTRIRGEKKEIFVCLKGNRWAHPISLFNTDIEVNIESYLDVLLKHLK